MLQRCGWDIVRFPPLAPKHPVDAWPSLKRLDIRTVIDVGAFDGDTARIFRDMWPNAEIHCFEPQAAPYAALKDWATQEAPHVRTYDCALGDAPGTATMRGFVGSTETPNGPDRLKGLNETSFVRRFEESSRERALFETTVRIERMDDVLNAAALTPGIFLKIDVEGFERAVLSGATAVLDRTAVCMIEVSTLFESAGAADMSEIATTLRRHNLAFAGMATQRFRAQHRRFMHGDAVFTNWSRCALRTDTQSASTHQG
jgi:FkbM family methyltransferase